MSPRLEVRPMDGTDVEVAEGIWNEAFAEMRSRCGFPARPTGPDHAERTRGRLRYFLASDPAGSWVATLDGRPVGVAQALRRERLWVLSLLGVALDAQGRGVGRQLLERALGYAQAGDAGLILSSADPRAMRRYVAAGFSLHPVVAAVGRVARERLPPPEGVREGSATDLDLAAAVDRQVRGAAREADLAHLLHDGARMLVVDGRGYAVVRGSQPVMLAALEEDSVRRLLAASLAWGPADQEVEVGWLGAGQQWAVHLAVAAGLSLRLSGAVMVRGMAAPPRLCLPNGAFG